MRRWWCSRRCGLAVDFFSGQGWAGCNGVIVRVLAVVTLLAFGLPAADALAIAIVSHELPVTTQGAPSLAALAGASGWQTLRKARRNGQPGAWPGPPGSV